MYFRYHEQAAKDAEIVYNHVQQLLQDINLPDDTITEHDVKVFCKHASELCVIRGTRIADEYERSGSVDNELCKLINILKLVSNIILFLFIIYTYY